MPLFVGGKTPALRYRKTVAFPDTWIVPGVSVFTVDLGLSEYTTLELVPGGADKDVTTENVLDFVERAAGDVFFPPSRFRSFLPVLVSRVCS